MTRRMITAAAGVAFSAAAAHAQSYASDFEAPLYSASPAGTLLTAGFTTPPTLGQDGWYIPITGSNDYYVLTYAGNTWGVPAHPSGGDQCAAGNLTPAGAFGRAQHAMNFSSGGKWKVTFDFTGFYTGTLPAVDNLASFSLQPSGTSRFFQTLMAYGSTAIGPAPNATNHTAAADAFHVAIGAHLATAPTTTVFNTPSADFRDLPVSNWYRVSVTWDFGTNQITSCSIQNLTTGGPVTTVDVTANGWYLLGGPAPTQPLPTDVRLFTGGGAGTGPAGNVAAWDNISITKIVTCYPDCDGSGTLTIADFGCFQTKFVQADPYADCDGNGLLTIADFGCFQTKFVQGCP